MGTTNIKILVSQSQSVRAVILGCVIIIWGFLDAQVKLCKLLSILGCCMGPATSMIQFIRPGHRPHVVDVIKTQWVVFICTSKALQLDPFDGMGPILAAPKYPFVQSYIYHLHYHSNCASKNYTLNFSTLCGVQGRSSRSISGT